MAGIHTSALTFSQPQLNIVCVWVWARYDTINKPQRKTQTERYMKKGKKEGTLICDMQFNNPEV